MADLRLAAELTARHVTACPSSTWSPPPSRLGRYATCAWFLRTNRSSAATRSPLPPLPKRAGHILTALQSPPSWIGRSRSNFKSDVHACTVGQVEPPLLVRPSTVPAAIVGWTRGSEHVAPTLVGVSHPCGRPDSIPGSDGRATAQLDEMEKHRRTSRRFFSLWFIIERRGLLGGPRPQTCSELHRRGGWMLAGACHDESTTLESTASSSWRRRRRASSPEPGRDSRSPLSTIRHPSILFYILNYPLSARGAAHPDVHDPTTIPEWYRCVRFAAKPFRLQQDGNRVRNQEIYREHNGSPGKPYNSACPILGSETAFLPRTGDECPASPHRLGARDRCGCRFARLSASSMRLTCCWGNATAGPPRTTVVWLDRAADRNTRMHSRVS